jgi:predicted Zn-dependent protease with MMP-like domain
MTDALAPSLDDFEALAHAAWEEMSPEFKSLTGDILFRVEDIADAAMLAVLGVEDPFELTGLYQGVDLTKRSIAEAAPATAIVFLFRRAILDEWIERGDVTLKELVAHVVVHEIGHHFGFSDDEMDAILNAPD